MANRRRASALPSAAPVGPTVVSCGLAGGGFPTLIGKLYNPPPPPPAGVPAAPGNLTAAAVSPSQINLTWADNSNNEASFIVSRATAAGGGGISEDIATLGANVTSYSNTGLQGGTTYYYKVRARNASGDSVNSNEPSATTWPHDIVADNENTQAFAGSANWSTGTSAADKYGADYRFRPTAAVGGKPRSAWGNTFGLLDTTQRTFEVRPLQPRKKQI